MRTKPINNDSNAISIMKTSRIRETVDTSVDGKSKKTMLVIRIPSNITTAIIIPASVVRWFLEVAWESLVSFGSSTAVVDELSDMHKLYHMALLIFIAKKNKKKIRI